MPATIEPLPHQAVAERQDGAANKNGTRHRRGRCGSNGTVVGYTHKQTRPPTRAGERVWWTEMADGFYADLRLRLIMSASPLKPRAKAP